MKTYIKESTGKLIVDYKARAWCKIPYPNHPKGCPNYGIRKTCPPQVPLIKDVVKLKKESYLIATRFNLGDHQFRMHIKHPKWTKKQCRNLLYWQGGVRKELKETCEEFIKEHKGMKFNLIPEAMGLNVITTANNLGIKVKKDPNTIIYKIALVYWEK